MQLDGKPKRLLGQDGLEYVREQLSNGGPLSRQLRESRDGGFVWELVIANQASQPQPKSYSVGGLFDAEHSTALWTAYAEFLRDFVALDSARVLLFENQFFRMTDPCLLQEESVFEWDGSSYYYLSHKGGPFSTKMIEEAMTMASDYPRVMLAVEQPKDIELPHRASLTSDLADALVRGIQHVLVGAYDGEGFVGWSRAGSRL